MFKNFKYAYSFSKGFSLVEVIASLAILTVLVAGSAPIFTKIIQERITVREQLLAYGWIENELAEWIASYAQPNPEITIEKNGTQYVFTSNQPSTHFVQFCVTWQGKNKRHYKICGSGKRT